MYRSFLLLLFSTAVGVTDIHKHGVELYKSKQYAEAVRILQEAAGSEKHGSPEYRESALLIGQSYFMLSQAPKSIPWLENLPDVNEANYMLGYAYLQAGNEENSEIAFARLFKLDPAIGSGPLARWVR